MAIFRSTPLKVALAAALLVGTAGCYQAMHQHHHGNAQLPEGAREVARATAQIAGKGGITGTATLIEYQHNKGPLVKVVVDVKGDPAVLTPGLHGIHIHAVGDCSAADFTSAGGHFDPGPASNVDPDMNHPFHMGDLPNLMVNAKGEGHLEALTSRVTITPGPLSMLDADGSAIIIHGKEDQWISGPKGSGVSGGPRIACGVIARD